MTALQKEIPEALGSVRQIARFLCGLNSPSITQAKLNKHPEFGSLAEVPFHLVMKAAETVLRPSVRAGGPANRHAWRIAASPLVLGYRARGSIFDRRPVQALCAKAETAHADLPQDPFRLCGTQLS